MITILTPTYNRAHTLPRLFASLREQTCQDFNWLLVDDGSSDGTAELIVAFGDECSFEIIYRLKDNGGKHSALNVGFAEKKHEWTLLVDSDDWLDAVCIERLACEAADVPQEVRAISFLKSYADGRLIGERFPTGMHNYLDRIRRGVTGDKADLLDSATLAGFRFPLFDDEKFMSESPLFLWFGRQHETRFVNYVGYLCEYQSDGLSASSVRNRHRNHRSSSYVYADLYSTLAGRVKARAAINWWRFNVNGPGTSAAPPLWYRPPGRLLRLIDLLRSNGRRVQ